MALITFLKRRNKTLVIIFILGKTYKTYRSPQGVQLGTKPFNQYSVLCKDNLKYKGRAKGRMAL